jgi:hypothetical protein
MWDNNATRRLLRATLAGLALYAVALASGSFEGARPEHALQPAQAALVPTRGNNPARLFLQDLCFRGPQGEAIDLTVVRHCPR